MLIADWLFIGRLDRLHTHNLDGMGKVVKQTWLQVQKTVEVNVVKLFVEQTCL